MKGVRGSLRGAARCRNKFVVIYNYNAYELLNMIPADKDLHSTGMRPCYPKLVHHNKFWCEYAYKGLWVLNHMCIYVYSQRLCRIRLFALISHRLTKGRGCKPRRVIEWSSCHALNMLCSSSAYEMQCDISNWTRFWTTLPLAPL